MRVLSKSAPYKGGLNAMFFQNVRLVATEETVSFYGVKFEARSLRNSEPGCMCGFRGAANPPSTCNPSLGGCVSGHGTWVPSGTKP